MLPWNNRLPHGSFFNFNFCFGQTNVKSKDLTLDRYQSNGCGGTPFHE
jgi:hypothetical protein